MSGKNEFILVRNEISDDIVEKHLINLNEATIKKYVNKIYEDERWKKSIENYREIIKRYNKNKYGFYFSDFLSNDMYENQSFDYIYFMENKNKFVKEKTIIKCIINEHIFIPFYMCGKGHKAICLIEFETKKPEILNKMVHKDYDINTLMFCSEQYYMNNK
jgi:hypothetical protein